MRSPIEPDPEPDPATINLVETIERIEMVATCLMANRVVKAFPAVEKEGLLYNELKTALLAGLAHLRSECK